MERIGDCLLSAVIDSIAELNTEADELGTLLKSFCDGVNQIRPLKKQCKYNNRTHYIWHHRKLCSDFLKIIENSLCSLGILTKSITHEKDCTSIVIDKSCATKWIMENCRVSEDFVHKSASSLKCLIHVPDLHSHSSTSCHLLRNLIFAENIKNILNCCGIHAAYTCKPAHEDIQVLCSHLGLTITSDKCEEFDDMELLKLLEHSTKCTTTNNSWIVKFDKVRVVHGNEIRSYTLVKDNEIWKQLCVLLSKLQKSNAEQMLHVVNSSHAYRQCIVIILCEELQEHLVRLTVLKCRHIIVEIGSMRITGSLQGTLMEYLDHRSQYLKQASIEKYGDEAVSGEFWSQRINQLTASTVKFEILTRKSIQSITIDLNASANDMKVASFVLYNYARLNTLFNTYQKQVTTGYYPPLPREELIDFTLLKSEDEWILVFHYINVYPKLVERMAKCVHSEAWNSNLVMQIPCFLHSLSRDLSTYYSRTHVLGESKPHLMPLMFARLSMLKRIQDIYAHGFTILNIPSYESM